MSIYGSGHGPSAVVYHALWNFFIWFSKLWSVGLILLTIFGSIDLFIRFGLVYLLGQKHFSIFSSAEQQKISILDTAFKTRNDKI